MKLTVDREADALYLDLDESPAAESEEVSPGVILDYNAAGKVVGIEMLYLSKRVATEKLGRMQFETVGGRRIRLRSTGVARQAREETQEVITVLAHLASFPRPAAWRSFTRPSSIPCRVEALAKTGDS
ncbi:MAG: DUF2283 domain-containing protein [Verrucomicrobiota bacterium]|jgi:uncharacterized protein YuzE